MHLRIIRVQSPFSMLRDLGLGRRAAERNHMMEFGVSFPTMTRSICNCKLICERSLWVPHAWAECLMESFEGRRGPRRPSAESSMLSLPLRVLSSIWPGHPLTYGMMYVFSERGLVRVGERGGGAGLCTK